MNLFIKSIFISILLLFSACNETSTDTTKNSDENLSATQNPSNSLDTTAPLFNTPIVDLKLNEGSTLIGTFIASDDSDITYSVNSSYYEITQTGSLSFVFAPTFDSKNSSHNHYEVTITATDSAKNSTILPVHIEILDISEEDNSAPVFAFSGSVYPVKQGVTSIESFSATDNSLVTYSLENSPEFSINENAILRFNTAPFYSPISTNNSYDVTIIATDTSNNTARLSFTVQVQEPTDIYSSVANNSHNVGKDCIQCHGDSLAVAGSIFGDNNKYNKIRLIEEGNLNEVIIKAVQGTGNFATQTALKDALYKVEVLDQNDQVLNESAGFTHNASRTNCNSCHTTNGTNGAPGRILNSRN